MSAGRYPALPHRDGQSRDSIMVVVTRSARAVQIIGIATGAMGTGSIFATRLIA